MPVLRWPGCESAVIHNSPHRLSYVLMSLGNLAPIPPHLRRLLLFPPPPLPPSSPRRSAAAGTVMPTSCPRPSSTSARPGRGGTRRGVPGMPLSTQVRGGRTMPPSPSHPPSLPSDWRTALVSMCHPSLGPDCVPPLPRRPGCGGQQGPARTDPQVHLAHTLGAVQRLKGRRVARGTQARAGETEGEKSGMYFKHRPCS